MGKGKINIVKSHEQEKSGFTTSRIDNTYLTIINMDGDASYR